MASRIALTPWTLLVALLLAACPALADIITFNPTSFDGTVAQSPGAAVFLAASLDGETLTFTWTANNTVVSSVNLYRVGSSSDVRIGSGVAQSSSNGSSSSSATASAGGGSPSSPASSTSSATTAAGGAATSATASATAPATTTESTSTSSSSSSPPSQPPGSSTGNSRSPLSIRRKNDGDDDVNYALTVFSDSSGGSVSIAPESYHSIAGNFSTLTLYFEALWDGGEGTTDSRPFVFASSADNADALAAKRMYEDTAGYRTEVVPPGYNPSSPSGGSGSSGNNTGGNGSSGNKSGGNSSSTSGTEAKTDKLRLSTGATVGIAVGCVLVGLLLFSAAAFFLGRRRGGARNRRLSGGPDDLAETHIMKPENLLPRRRDSLSLALVSTRPPMTGMPRSAELFGIGGGRTRSQQQHEDLAMAEKTGMAAAAVAVAEVDSPQSLFSDDTSFGHQGRGFEQQENQPQQSQQQHQQQQQLGWSPDLPQPQQTFGPDFGYQVGESDDTIVNDIGVAISVPDAVVPQRQKQQQQPTWARGSVDRRSPQPQQEQPQQLQPQQLQPQQLQQRQQQQPGERGESAAAGLAPGAVTAGNSPLLRAGVYAHLVEEGMTPDELQRLEEEERALDEAIQQRARK